MVKYFYKYVYKGHDRAIVELEGIDEIKTYLDARFVSAPECIWRIFSFKLHDEYPSVEQLAIHLPSEQSVLFDSRDTMMTSEMLGKKARPH